MLASHFIQPRLTHKSIQVIENMDKKTVFVKTNTGESEVSGKSDVLYGDAKRILLLVDDESTVGEISKRAPPSLRESLENELQELVDGAYIRDMRAPVNVPQKPALKMSTPAFKMATPKPATPSMPSPAPVKPSNVVTNTAAPSMSMPDMMMPKMSPPDIKKEEPAKADKKSDLDFSFITSGSSPGQVDSAADKEKAKADADRLRAAQAAQIEATAQAAKMKAYEAAQAKAQEKAKAEAGKLKAYEEAKEKAKAEVAARALIEAEARARKEAETLKLKAEQDAMKMRTELEATKARVEAEVRTRIEAETRIKQEAEAIRLQAVREAEKLRLELEASKAKAELEIRNRLEAEARAKAEAEARRKREADAELLRLQKERAELELARVKAEAEIKMRAEAEVRVRAEVEARLKAEALAQERTRAAAEAEIKMRAEAEVRVRAEVEARLKAEELTRHVDRRSTSIDEAGVNPVQPGEDKVDQAEKLRQSFVESFSQQKKKQESNTGSFKLEQFSFVNTGKMPAAIAQPVKPEVLPGGGSKVKAAIELRAQKEAEALRIKSEQEAGRLKAEQDEAARIKSEQDSIHLKAEQAAYRLKKQQEEEQAIAEAEARKLSEQQTKQWEEGQRRAAIQAQAENERLAQQSAKAQAKLKQKPSRGPRKPLPIGKMIAGLFVLALIAVAGLPYVWPLAEYIAPLEKEISAQLNQPIKINTITMALLPTPKLELHNLTVGGAQELKVGEAVLNFDFSALFASTKSISNMELNNVILTGASLDKVVAWIQAVGGNEVYPVAHMALRNMHVNTDEIKLPLLNGSVKFDTQGKFTNADLKSEDGKFSLELQPQQNHMQLELNIHESSLPIFTSIKFNDLSVNGVIANGEVILTDFFAHIHGGTLTGKGLLNWNNGWRLQGQVNAKSLDMQRMFPNFGLSGELIGDVKVSMYGPELSRLDKDPVMEGTFEAKNGVINKLDVDAVARFGARPGVAGHTDFNELNGNIKSDSHGQRIYMSKISSVAVNGTGLVEVDENQQLSGKLSVDIKGPANGSVVLQLSGTATNPVLQSGR
jgi:hypothetical protein